jgi:murein peptide amidase A
MKPTTSLFSIIQERIGVSVEGRPIQVIRFLSVTDDVVSEATLPIRVLYLGAFHGDEGISAMLLERFAEWLFQLEVLPETFSAIQQPVCFAIVPMVNPDGLNATTRVNANHVDLNRNWPTQDWAVLNEGTAYYSGPKPASEPETQAIQTLIESFQPHRIISVHSPYKVVNYDGPEEALALANRMSAYNHYPVVADIGYPTPGSFGTFTGKERGIPTLTLELPEDEPLEAVWQANHQSLWEMLF